MKKFSIGMMALILFLTTVPLCTFANSFGVNYAYSYFEDNPGYENDSACAQTKIFSNRYAVAMRSNANAMRVQLIILENNGTKKRESWQAMLVSSLALFQNTLTPILDLSQDGTELTILYTSENSCSFTFSLDTFQLLYGQMTSDRITYVTRTADGYYFSNDAISCEYPYPIMLNEFNIELFPKSVVDAKRLVENRKLFANRMPAPVLCTSTYSARLLPVYACPDSSGYRAANGKAALSTGGSYTIYGQQGGWTMVEYSVNHETSRIGWVEGLKMQDPDEVTQLTLSNQPCQMVRSVCMTDDPHVSQKPMHGGLSVGTQVTYLSTLPPYYAYISSQIGAETAYEFVPLSSISPYVDDQEERQAFPDALSINAASGLSDEVLTDKVSPVGFAKVNKDKVNFRKEPQGDILRRLEKDETVFILDAQQHNSKLWYQISTYIGKNNTVGWVDASYITPIHSLYQDIVQIDCSDHLVAMLHKDGTVSAIGDYQPFHSIDMTAQWKDISSISVKDRAVIGLEKNGCLASTGFNVPNIGHWEDLVWISSSAQANGGVREIGVCSDGSAVTNLYSFENDTDEPIKDAQQIVFIDCGNRSYGAVLHWDGTVQPIGTISKENHDVICGWKDITKIVTGADHIVALCADGTVKAAGCNNDGQCEVSNWSDILDITAFGGTTFGVKKDGNVVMAGFQNKNYQPALSWNHIVQLAVSNPFIVGLRTDGTVVMAGAYHLWDR